ncbi:MAG: DinB family protein [Planctomycetes bacterium]|nr:DinB family protein [Planctomycetota bacterium]
MNAESLALLLDVIDQGFDRQSWHGPNLRGAIRGVTHEEAAWRPQHQRHNIWEHVLHAAYWKYTVRRRILNEKRGSFPLKGSNWITPAATTAEAWRRDVQLLVDTHQSMRAAIADLPPDQLPKPLPGAKITYFFLISGIAAHDAYHAGQIQLLRRLAGSG